MDLLKSGARKILEDDILSVTDKEAQAIKGALYQLSKEDPKKLDLKRDYDNNLFQGEKDLNNFNDLFERDIQSLILTIYKNDEAKKAEMTEYFTGIPF